IVSLRISTFVPSFFFFSSRRRHTRSKRDWSSDVCSSDLARLSGSGITLRDVSFSYSGKEEDTVLRHIDLELPAGTFTALVGPSRSEERRVGKECSTRGATDE